mmetsp:Transcript_20286/g.42500  ORF Transcript_20286/g.42500 Transcript_20286/m.42500 type:complete len:194 (-) Transcript_20286:60-641(-)
MKLKQGTTNQISVVVFFMTTTLGAVTSFAPYSDNGSPSPFRLFSLHPLFMYLSLMAFIVGKLYKKVGGYSNTKLHGNLSSFGSLCMSVGFYAIYKNKENNGKAHFTTTHSQYAFLLMGCICVLLLNGAVGLHPDWGKVKTNKTIRAVHHWSGKFMLVLMCFVCWQGSMKIVKGEYAEIVFGLPLAGLAALSVL